MAPISSGVSIILFLYILFEAFAKKRVAGDNPWGVGATTLEWTRQFAAAIPFL